MKSPMLKAIESTVAEQLGDILGRVKALEKKIDKVGDSKGEVTLAELDKTVKRTLDEALESDLPDRINQAVLQMLATPAKAAKAKADDGDCGHVRRSKKCASCREKIAAENDAAEAGE